MPFVKSLTIVDIVMGIHGDLHSLNQSKLVRVNPTNNVWQKKSPTPKPANKYLMMSSTGSITANRNGKTWNGCLYVHSKLHAAVTDIPGFIIWEGNV